jgi:hypothetical protein
MIVINDPEAFDVLAHTVDIPYCPGKDWCIAKRDDRGDLVGAGMLCGFTGVGGSVQAHIAGFKPRWLDRVLLYAFFDMAFKHLRVGKILGIVPELNYDALRLDRHIGMVEEAKIDGVFTWEGNVCAAIILSMTREQCRFLEPPRRLRHGRE